MRKQALAVMSVVVTAVVLGTVLSSCGGPKAITPASRGEVEVIVPCAGPEFQSNSKALRYSAIGESRDQMTAKRKAMSEARAGLAASISTLVKGVTDNYVKSSNYDDKEELLKNYEGMNREVVNQTLSGTTVICEKATMTQAGTHKYYVCIELGGAEILQSINNKMTQNEILKVDYNYEKFKKTFEDEMSKMGQ